jgi:type VI secretion system secreted protein VgrG
MGQRFWSGVCSRMDLVRVEPTGLSTYEITIVPALWLLTQRRNHRHFQHVSIPAIVDRLLAEWSIEPVWQIDRAAYPDLELRIQAGESDYAFFSRLLEEAGFSFYFSAARPEKGSQLVLDDRPQNNKPRLGGLPIPFLDSPQQAAILDLELLTAVRLTREVRPGRFTIRDFDFLNPRRPLTGEAPAAPPPEDRYEQYHYLPGSFLREEGPGSGAGNVAGATPIADGLGTARFAEEHGRGLSERNLEAVRVSQRQVSYETSVIGLAPGVVFRMGAHPHAELAPGKDLLVTRFFMEGRAGEPWRMRGGAVFAEHPYRPAMVTPKPRIHGVQSALVVGPPGQEIYTDEHGRVRVQFHWDREGRKDPESSIWMRVSQGWAGVGYGMINLPRVGQEVLVGFLDGDPDSPIIVGRLFNVIDRVPYPLPAFKTVSTWRSHSSPSTGGYNEIGFEDAAGREQVFIQAEKDLSQVVKHDERIAVGHDRHRLVQNEETIEVLSHRSKFVGGQESEVTAMRRITSVGLDRHTSVGTIDHTFVGSRFTVSIMPELEKALSAEIGAAASAQSREPVAHVIGAFGTIPFARPPLPTAFDLDTVFLGNAAPVRSAGLPNTEDTRTTTTKPVTEISMEMDRISLRTSKASIVLEGSEIWLMAEGGIHLQSGAGIGATALENIHLGASGKVDVRGDEGVRVEAQSDVVIQGGPMVMLNPDIGPSLEPIDLGAVVDVATGDLAQPAPGGPVLPASVLQGARRDVLLIKDRMSAALDALGPRWAASLAAGATSHLVATALAHLLFTRLPPALQSRLWMSIETFEPYGGDEQTSWVSLHLRYAAGARMAFHMRHDAEQGLTFQNASFFSAEDTTNRMEVTHYDPVVAEGLLADGPLSWLAVDDAAADGGTRPLERAATSDEGDVYV